MNLQERNENKINSLHPLIRDYVRNLISCVKLDLGIDLVVTYGFRSFKEQDLIYQKGRDLVGEIVTYARGGESYHNYGLAFDVKPDLSYEEVKVFNFAEIGAIGKKIGFEWGGNFTVLDDKRHFQKRFGLNYSEMHELVKENNLTDGFITITKFCKKVKIKNSNI